MELNKGKEALPLYVQVKQDIRMKIDDRIWNPGDKIPSETEFCELYNVSRITVREAINELVNEKYLVRQRAKGTFVLEREYEYEFSTYIKNFTFEMKELGFEAVTLVATISLVKADKKIAEILKIPIDSDVYLLTRTRGTMNTAIVYFKTYLPSTLNLPIDSKEYYGSLYELLLEKTGVIISKINESLEAIVPTKEIQQHLNIKNTPILKRSRICDDQYGETMEYTEGYYVGDRYKYFVDFVKKMP